MKRQTVGVYLIRDNKILFLIRQKKLDTRHIQGTYLPVGGQVELGESLESAAIREVVEESSIKISSLELRGIVYITGQASGESDIMLFLFTSSDFTGEAIDGNEGTFEWVDKARLDKINLYDGDKVFLKYLLANKFFVLEFQYKGFEFLGHTVLYSDSD